MISVHQLALAVLTHADSNVELVHHCVQLDVKLLAILHVVQYVHILAILTAFILAVNNAVVVVIFAIHVYQCVSVYVQLNANLDVPIVHYNVDGGVIVHAAVDVHNRVMEVVHLHVVTLVSVAYQVLQKTTVKRNVNHSRLLRRNMNDTASRI